MAERINLPLNIRELIDGIRINRQMLERIPAAQRYRAPYCQVSVEILNRVNTVTGNEQYVVLWKKLMNFDDVINALHNAYS